MSLPPHRPLFTPPTLSTLRERLLSTRAPLLKKARSQTDLSLLPRRLLSGRIQELQESASTLAHGPTETYCEGGEGSRGGG